MGLSLLVGGCRIALQRAGLLNVAQRQAAGPGSWSSTNVPECWHTTYPAGAAGNTNHAHPPPPYAAPIAGAPAAPPVDMQSTQPAVTPEVPVPPVISPTKQVQPQRAGSPTKLFAEIVGVCCSRAMCIAVIVALKQPKTLIYRIIKMPNSLVRQYRTQGCFLMVRLYKSIAKPAAKRVQLCSS